MNAQASAAAGKAGGVTLRSVSAAPVRKVTAGALAAALTTVLVYVLQTAFALTISAEVAAAATTILGFLAAYLIPPAEGETVEVPA